MLSVFLCYPWLLCVQGFPGDTMNNLWQLRTLKFHLTTFDWDFLVEFNGLDSLEHLSFWLCDFFDYDDELPWVDFGSILHLTPSLKTLGEFFNFLSFRVLFS